MPLRIRVSCGSIAYLDRALQLLELRFNVWKLYPFRSVWQFLVIENSSDFPDIWRPRSAFLARNIEQNKLFTHSQWIGLKQMLMLL